ncbi:protein TASOR 2 isoform X2 [Phyllobates terribilis]|uniref:protein TASOR 2 isoform X2 n=1 Tax=Phyllobates terribilis TaxID=111132 RepID=UPI003CCB0EB9
MQVLEDSDMIQLNNAAQYNAWKGQLYIHEQLVCDISFQTSSIFSIPAQLPEKLDVREVIRVSELRKKLPEDIFQKTDFTGQEVFCGNIYYSLFPVVPTNIVGSEFDKVLKYLKDEDLALIKVLNDQGFLILVNSAILPNRTGVFDRNSVQLNALFLFPHQKFLHQKDREEWENKFIRKELPLAVSNLLPGLHYAIIEANKLQKDKALYPAPLVEQYFRKYAVLPGKKDSSSERKSEQSAPLSALHSPVDDLPQKCSPLAFSCLKLYISSPLQFSVSVIKMNNILAENAFISSNADQFGKTAGSLIKQDNRSSPSKTAESKAGSGRRKGKRGVHENKEQHSKKTTKRRSVKRREKKSKKKSVKQAALTTAETGENQTSNKRRRLLSEGKKPIASSSEATVKLAHVPYPQRRKRGAEVLSAAFIQDEKIQTTEKITPSKANEKKNLAPQTKAMKRKPQKAFSPEQHIVLPDRRSKRKMSDPGKIIMAVEAINKSESLKKASERRRGKRGRTNTRTQQKMKAITVEQINTSGKSSESLKDAQKWPSPPIPEDSILDKRISMYESHALNLLADLALNSFGSSNTPYLNVNVASAPELLVEEGAPRDDHVSTVEPPGKAYSPPAPSTTPCPEPEHTLESDKPKNGFNVSPRSIASQKRFETGEKQISQKAHIAAAKAKARYNATSKICLEHSYSQLPLGIIPGKSTKEANEKPIQGVPDSTTSADVVPESADGLSEKVVLSGGSESLVTGSKQRGVFKLRDNVLITIHWEPSYDFDLDSKFTSDPLEKTINRALHGPWNPHLKEKVEDVKIILHMWIALFYSKSKKQIHCNSRKVVEHSNPAKYVSINTVLDPFEFYEIMETDNAASTLNTNVILPMGKKSEALRLENLAKAGKSESVSLQDLTLPSIPTKAKSKETEHEYVRNFFAMNEAEKLIGSQTNFSKIVRSNVNDNEGHVKACESVSAVGHTSHTHSDLFSLHDVTMATTSRDSHETTAKLKLADKNEEYSCIGSKTIHRPEIPTRDTNKNPASVDQSSENDKDSNNLVKDLELTKHIDKSPSDRNDANSEFCMDKNSKIVDYLAAEALKCNDEEASEMIHVGAKNISSSESVDAKANSKLIQSEEHFRQVVDSTENIASRPRLPLEGLASYNISKPVDYASDCTEGSKTRSSWDCVGFEDAQEKAMEDIPDESENLVEPKYTHKLDEDDLNEVEKTENEAATEKSFLSLNIAQSRLFGYSADFSNVAATDEGIKESEASNHDMNQNLVESLSASSTKEDSSTHEKAEALHDEACLVHEPSSATASSFELDTNAIIYTLGNLDIKDSSESTMECEEHVHKDMLAESHNRLLISQTQFDVEKIQNSSCLEGTVNEKVDLSGSAVKEMEIDALSTKTESPACQNVVIECVSLGTSRDMLEGESDVSDSNETALHLNITSSFSDQLMRRYSEMDSLQPSVGKQQLDPTGDASPTVKPIRSAKGSTHINRSSSSNKKEFLSKLKRICLGSIAGHQVSSNFENVLSGDESSINGFTSDKNEVMDEAKIVLPLEEDINILKNLDDVVEKTGMENCNVEPEKLAMEQCNVDVKEPAVENCSVEAEEPAVDTCSVEAEEPAVDTCSVEAEEPAVDTCSVEAEEPAVDTCSVEAEEPAVDTCSVEAEEPAVDTCSVEAEEPAVDTCSVEAEEPAVDTCSVEAEEPAVDTCSVEAEEPAVDTCSVEAEEPAVDTCSVEAEEPAVDTCSVEAEEPAVDDCSVEAEEPAVDYCSVEAEEPAVDTCSVEAEEPAVDYCSVEAEEPAVDYCSVEAEEPAVDYCSVEAEEPAVDYCSVEAEEPAVDYYSVEAEEPAVDYCSVEAEEPAVDYCSVEAEEPAVDYYSVEAEEPAVDYCSVEAEEPAVDYCSVEAEEPAVGYCSVEAEEPAVDNCILEAEEFTMDNLSVVAEETIMENCDVISEEPIIDSSSEELINENFVEPELLEEAMPPQDNRLISPSFENVSDSIEQDASPKLPDICFIVNTGSISKEQYDRWSETSDDDIEYIRSYTEPLSHQKDFQEDIPEPPRSLPEEVKPLQELTPANRAKKSFRKHSGSNSGLYEAEENMSLHLKDLEYNSKTNHGNLTVTRNIKDPECATRTIRKEISRSDFDHVFSGNRTVSDDLTQNTLDMENVRFTCNLKEILRKSSKEKYTHGPRSQTMFEARRIPSCSPSTIKCINPLLITLRCPYRRTDFRRPDSRHSSTYNTSPYYEDELWDEPVTYSRTIRKVRTQRYSPFHFSRLRYETPLDKSNSDISAILNECVQSNHLKLSSVGLGNAAVDRTSGSQLAEEGGQQARTSVPVSSKSQSFKNIISDLCTSLHSRLQNVARETEQKMSFYIYETDDADFISSAKSLLVKDGHVPIDPWDFLNNERCESHQLLVIIKNEDVVSCINKIPYLMQLKLLHNVTFAGVDTPEDLAESAYEELFQAGGFVVSDKSVLESITLGKLKEVIAILEKMSRTSPWKWLIHYRENRKLKEDKRTEDLSQAKMALLKSYQQCNIIEILPYHQCDSRSKEPSDDLACLQNLQYQHSHSRLAVYLTGTTSTLSAECEQNGILVYDVDTFLRTIQKVDSQLQTSNRS